MGRVFVPLAGLFLLGGCVSAVKTVVTAPFKVGGAVVDAATTSQSEADEKRGREMRKAEEREAKERRRAEKEEKRRAREDAEGDGY
jgi:hypothetical protein